MTTPLEVYDLLSICAAMYWFDAELLRALLPHIQQPIEQIPSSYRIGYNEQKRRYSLQLLASTELTSTPKGLDPEASIFLHEWMLDYHLPRLADDLDSEAAYVHHLHFVFLNYMGRGLWPQFQALLDQLEQQSISERHHRQRLRMYRGYANIYTQNYAVGEQELLTLLKEPDLDTKAHVHSLNALGNGWLVRSEYGQAITYYQQLEHAAQHLNQPQFLGIAWLNLSMSYNELEQYARAYELAHKSLVLFREHNETRRAAFAHYGIGLNAMYQGYWNEAQTHLNAAIKGFEAEGIPSGLAASYWNYGFLLHLFNRIGESEAAYTKALELAQKTNQPNVELDVMLYLGFLYHTQGNFASALPMYDAALKNVQLIERTHRINLIQFLRGHIFTRQGMQNRAKRAFRTAIESSEHLAGKVKQDMIKIALLGTTRHSFDAIVSLALEQNQIAQAFADVERASARALIDALAQKDPELSQNFDQATVTLADVQAQLPAHAVLVEYFTTGVQDRSDHFLRGLPPESHYLRDFFAMKPACYVFVVTRDHASVQPLKLDPNKLQPSLDDPQPVSRFLNERMLQLLHRELIAPIEHLIADHELIYLVPHGALHYVPFMSLHDKDGVCLLDEHALVLAPSATILLRNCLARPHYHSAPSLALGYNDPHTSLVYAEMEARMVSQMLGGAWWVGSEPKSDRLLAIDHPLRVLHIASHTQFNPNDPLESYLVIGENDHLSALTIMTKLNLQVDVVALSSCTSILGKVLGNDELLGLQRAFLFAGTPTIIGALWDVPDLVALLVMHEFYQALITMPTVAQALRHALLQVRRMNGAAIVQCVQQWQQHGLLDNNAFDLNAVAPHDLPFSEPYFWASFNVFGRA